MEKKFKAWHPNSKKWFKDFFLSSDGAYIYETGDHYNVENGEMVVCQYTGLKDVNGKEIYEGDVLDMGIGAKEIVEFKKGCFWLRHRHRPLYEWLLIDEDSTFEIIGNIYEHPHLIPQPVNQ
jgi:uncharacterized phage protein (TIGR01671 family)